MGLFWVVLRKFHTEVLLLQNWDKIRQSELMMRVFWLKTFSCTAKSDEQISDLFNMKTEHQVLISGNGDQLRHRK